MRNLNRRDFIKILGAIPLLPWLKPESAEVELPLVTWPKTELSEELTEDTIVDIAEPVVSVDPKGNLYYSDWVTPNFTRLAVWDGNAWKELEGYTK